MRKHEGLRPLSLPHPQVTQTQTPPRRAAFKHLTICENLVARRDLNRKRNEDHTVMPPRARDLILSGFTLS